MDCTSYYSGARLDSISKEGGGGILLVAMSAAKAAVSTGVSSAGVPWNLTTVQSQLLQPLLQLDIGFAMLQDACGCSCDHA